MSDPSRCGPHTQIAQNERLRITQCACGSYHVNFPQKGVTVQLGLEDVRAIAASGTGSTIN